MMAERSEKPESAEEKKAKEAESAFEDIEDGAGCAEIWEKLSSRRGEDR